MTTFYILFYLDYITSLYSKKEKTLRNHLFLTPILFEINRNCLKKPVAKTGVRVSIDQNY